MASYVALLLSVMFNAVMVQVYSKEMFGQGSLMKSLQEERQFDRLVEDKRHGENDEKLARRKIIKTKLSSLMQDYQYQDIQKMLKSKNRKFEGNFIPKDAYEREKRKFVQALKENLLYRRTLTDGIYLQQADCGLRLTAIELPPPRAGFYYPNFVMLHRCTGGCSYRPSDKIHCEAKNKTNLSVITSHIVYNSQNFSELSISMVNHTECGCDCKVKPSDCNSDTEDYNLDTCGCQCREFSDDVCNNTLKKWDTQHCSCQCKGDPFPCDHRSKIWSERTCKCECLDNIQKRCKRKNKLLNRDTCTCYCDPTITCPPGQTIVKSDCSCDITAK